MADKLTDLTAATDIADGDEFYVVDVSDTTDNAAGTSKRSAWSLIKSALAATFVAKSGETDTVDLTGSAAVTVPVPADGATQAAAQVTDKDSTTDQLQIGGFEVGDTKWRDITADCSNITMDVGGEVQVRRIGNVVYWQIVLGGLPTGSGLGSVIWNPPTGFRGPDAMGRMRERGDATNIWDVGYVEGFGTYTPDTLASSIKGSIQWLCSDAWPTTLPGTAA